MLIDPTREGTINVALTEGIPNAQFGSPGEVPGEAGFKVLHPRRSNVHPASLSKVLPGTSFRGVYIYTHR